MANVKQAQQMIPFITREFSFGWNVSELVLASMYLIWILESNLIRSNKPIKSNSMDSGNVSHCRTSAFNDHLDHNFIVLRHIQ